MCPVPLPAPCHATLLGLGRGEQFDDGHQCDLVVLMVVVVVLVVLLLVQGQAMLSNTLDVRFVKTHLTIRATLPANGPAAM